MAKHNFSKKRLMGTVNIQIERYRDHAKPRLNNRFGANSHGNIKQRENYMKVIL